VDVQFYVKSKEWVLADSVLGFEGWKMPTSQAVKIVGKNISAINFWNLMPTMEQGEKLWILERKRWPS